MTPDAISLPPYTITDRAPLLGWTVQRLKNQALIRAVIRRDLPGMQAALLGGANPNAPCKLRLEANGVRRDFKGTPLCFALQKKLADEVLFLLSHGAKTDDNTTRDFLGSGMWTRASEAQLHGLGLKLVEAGWNLRSADAGDEVLIRLFARAHPTLVKDWKTLFQDLQLQNILDKNLPRVNTTPPIPGTKHRL
jgi:hypothetical protein